MRLSRRPSARLSAREPPRLKLSVNALRLLPMPRQLPTKKLSLLRLRSSVKHRRPEESSQKGSGLKDKPLLSNPEFRLSNLPSKINNLELRLSRRLMSRPDSQPSNSTSSSKLHAKNLPLNGKLKGKLPRLRQTVPVLRSSLLPSKPLVTKPKIFWLSVSPMPKRRLAPKLRIS